METGGGWRVLPEWRGGQEQLPNVRCHQREDSIYARWQDPPGYLYLRTSRLASVTFNVSNSPVTSAGSFYW